MVIPLLAANASHCRASELFSENLIRVFSFIDCFLPLFLILEEAGSWKLEAGSWSALCCVIGE